MIVRVSLGDGRTRQIADENTYSDLDAAHVLRRWHVPMVNAAGSPTFYEFDSTELLELYKDMWDRDEEPVVIYHSHTATEAYPSRTDISYANEPGAHYVLVSTADTDGAGEFQFRSFRIVDGEVTEEEVRVVETY